MNQILDRVSQVSPVALLIGGAFILGLISLFLFIRRKTFLKGLEELIADPELEAIPFVERFGIKRILNESRTIIRISRKREKNLPALLGMTSVWIEKCQKKNQSLLMDRILEFAPDQGLFFLFKGALVNRKIGLNLNKHLEDSDELIKLRKMALSGSGADFNGLQALELFHDRLDEMREMMGDPEWAVRFFAINILLYDGDDRSGRAIWDSFHDPHGLIRKTVASGAPSDLKAYSDQEGEREGIFNRLYDLLLNDPVFEVRQAARERIEKDFTAVYSPVLKDLTNEQALHILQLLSPRSKEDQNLALGILEGEDSELNMISARYLQDCGVLNRLFKESYLSDKQVLERNYKLLLNALEVNVSGFLEEIKGPCEGGSLLLASRLLRKGGPHRAITLLAKKVFALKEEDKIDSDQWETYQNTLLCIKERGNDQSYEALAEELSRVKGNKALVKELFLALPHRGSEYFMPVLESFLKDFSFLLKDELRTVFLNMDAIYVTDLVMEIIKKGRESYSHSVRIQALKILGEMKLESCLQVILENMPILPLDEAREFASLLSSYSEKLFNERVGSILNSHDAHSRASLIVSLPATGKKTFIKEIREALSDADPEVRIAAVWALTEYGESRELARCINMLRDPVERVRVEVARALGTGGTGTLFKDLEALLNDENEVDSVKLGVIMGLAESQGVEAVDILARKIAQDDHLKQPCVLSLSKRADKKSVTAMVEQFKNGSPQLREDLCRVFKIMGPRGEQIMEDLLKEDIPSLHTYIAEVLDFTGFVEARIRLLKHRDHQIRRNAASVLSAVRSKASFRGIVLAARDPNRDVRIEVIKALESLNTGNGKEILTELENDPDKKVRKYTLWAMERIKSKSLE